MSKLTIIERNTATDGYLPYYGAAETYWTLCVNGQPFMRSLDRQELWALAWQVARDMHQAGEAA
jgi:hypothetical protein